jgi:transcriptional regulator with XRE-family HTH domain
MNMSIFAERLSELLFEKELNAPALAKILGCGQNTINRYLSGNNTPSVNMLLRLADYFQCSSDFLLGLEAENYAHSFNPCPPFRERLPFLCRRFGRTKYALQKGTGIPESAIYNWQRGDSTPSLDNVVKIAEFFDCTVDFVLGREV